MEQMMEYILSQIFGFLVFIFVFLSMQMTKMKYTLLCQLFCNGLGMFSYVLIGGFSGFGIYLIATIQCLVFFLLRSSGKEAPRWTYPIIYAAYIGCSVLTFHEALDIVPLIAALLCASALIQKQPSKYRIIVLLNGITWIIYDICIGAYTMLATHIFSVSSALSGIIRLDISKKKADAANSPET